MKDEQFTLNILPLPEVVLFPGMQLPLFIYEKSYISLVQDCLNSSKQLGIVLAQGDSCTKIGTIAEIVNTEQMENEKMNVLLEGRGRFEILKMQDESLLAEAKPYGDMDFTTDRSFKQELREVKSLAKEAINMLNKISDKEKSRRLKLPKDPSELIFLVAANLNCDPEEKQRILEGVHIKERTSIIIPLLKEEREKLQVMLENKNTKSSVEKNGHLEHY